MSVLDSPISSSLSEAPLGEVNLVKDETIEYREGDWENDPQNARNWTSAQKWTAVAIVRLRVLASYL